VSFLRNLFFQGLRGPFLVLAPTSCTPHWQREFETWQEEMHVVRIAGDAKSRAVLEEYELSWGNAQGNVSPLSAADKAKSKGQLRPNVVIVSYDVFRGDIEFYRSVAWQVLVVDEAHQIRNEETQLYQRLEECRFVHSLFLTGTPIQNNLGELFTLLHFLDPDEFDSREEFNAKYAHLQTSGQASDVTALQEVIRPYFYRRMKHDVEKSLQAREETLIEVELTSMQKQYVQQAQADVGIARASIMCSCIVQLSFLR
jgi:chromodomain-helicase-DNA-binding protein 7